MRSFETTHAYRFNSFPTSLNDEPVCAAPDNIMLNRLR